MPLLLAASLAGCATAKQPPEGPKIFGRVDCQRNRGNPVLEREFEQAKAICIPRAEAAATAGTAAMPMGSGIGGAIVSGIEQGVKGREIANATALSCMAERGYLLKTMAEHDAICVAIEAQRQ